MNRNLIFQLSLIGLAMAIATVFWIPSSIEPAFWLVIFIVSAYFIAKKAPGRYFLHGFLVSLVNCVWITSAHIIFFETYLAHHPAEASMLTDMPAKMPPRLMMLVTGVGVGIISGLILGLFSFIASKLVKRRAIL